VAVVEVDAVVVVGEGSRILGSTSHLAGLITVQKYDWSAASSFHKVSLTTADDSCVNGLGQLIDSARSVASQASETGRLSPVRGGTQSVALRSRRRLYTCLNRLKSLEAGNLQISSSLKLRSSRFFVGSLSRAVN
jgi:hypothetical protein